MDNASKSKLKSSLGLFDATGIGLGAIIGGGIFIVTGIVAGLAGPALMLSIIIAAVISLFTALSFAELTRWQPAEGGVYIYAHSLLSPFTGFLAGWMWIVSNIFSGAAVSLGFAHYLEALLPVVDHRLVAAVLCIVLTLLNYIGVKHSALFNNALVTVKISVLLTFIIVGAFHFKAANFSHFPISKTGIFHGAFFIFFAFAGFARVATVAEEVKNAKKVVPQSIMLALFISTIIYILVGIVALGLIGPQILRESNSPLADAIAPVGAPVLKSIVSLGGMFAMASVLLTSILGVSRMAFSMSREKDLPSPLSRLHPKFKTPSISVLIVGAIILAISLLFPLTKAVTISVFATIFNYSLANVSALRLKSKDKIYPRFVPATGFILCLILLIFVQKDALWIGGCSLLAAIFYWLLKKKIKKYSG
jgi:APA family basic amino acid/polyamine antiporter